MKKTILPIAVGVALGLTAAASAGTLDDVKAKGFIQYLSMHAQACR